MFNFMNKVKAEVRVSDYTMVISIDDDDDKKVLYIDFSDYLSAEFTIKPQESGFACVMKCEDEEVEKVLHVFEDEKKAKKFLNLISAAMLKEKTSAFSLFKKLFKFVIKAGAVLLVLAGILYMLLAPRSAADIANASAVQGDGNFRQEVLPEGKSVPLSEAIK